MPYVLFLFYMKRILNILFVLIFLFSTFISVVFAKEAMDNGVIIPTPTSALQTIKYDLAYPGMLPDNPLYKIKVARDKIIALLINDPRKKIDFYLLQADKGILASGILVEKNNISLAEETALKAEHNMTMLNNEFQRMPVKPDSALFTKLKTAGVKHQEVLASIIEKLPKDQQKTFKQIIDFSKRNVAMVEKYEKRNPRRWNKSDSQ